MRRTPVFSAAVLLPVAAAALAGSLDGLTPAGRYALDAAGCKVKDYFATLTETAIVLPTFSCEGVAFDQTEKRAGRAVFIARAKACVGEETLKAAPDAFSLALEDGVLQFSWKDGTKSAKLRRCPAHRGER
ncbi:MAG: hypothetical protein C3F11_16255 [Methylocystaceae bacterium]|nr:MAG: hypothetical protein C3F11_16255 [Methylocystaceae bacterium]